MIEENFNEEPENQNENQSEPKPEKKAKSPTIYGELPTPFTVYIGNLSFKATTNDIVDALKQFGKIVFADVSLSHDPTRNKGYGFVSFENQEDMNKAILSNTKISVLGRKIGIHIAAHDKVINDYNYLDGFDSDQFRHGDVPPPRHMQSYSSGNYSSHDFSRRNIPNNNYHDDYYDHYNNHYHDHNHSGYHRYSRDNYHEHDYDNYRKHSYDEHNRMSREFDRIPTRDHHYYSENYSRRSYRDYPSSYHGSHREYDLRDERFYQRPHFRSLNDRYY